MVHHVDMHFKKIQMFNSNNRSFFFFIDFYTCIVKTVYKGHSRESENMPFITSCPLYTG